MIKLVSAASKKLRPTFIALLVIFIFLLTPWGRISIKSLVLLSQFSPRQEFGAPGFLNSKFTVGQVNIEVKDEKIPADIYKPSNNKNNPAVIFFIGTRERPNNASVQKYAKLFASAGFVVIVPEISDLVEMRIRDTTIDKIVGVFDYTSGLDFVDPGRVGFSGICAGGALSLLAASDERINNKVKFVNVVSPYFDVWDFSRESFTKKVNINGRVEAWQQSDDGKLQLQYWYIGQVKDNTERKFLEDTLLNSRVISGENLANLSDDAKNIVNFINSDGSNFDNRRELLSQEVKFQVEAMSQRNKVSNLKAKVYIVADSFDSTVSPTHSRILAESLPKDQMKFSYISVLDHVVPTRTLKRAALLQDGIKIYQHIYSFLSYLDTK